MSAPSEANVAAQRAEARTLLAHLDQVDLERYSVVGQYLRFDEAARHGLKEFEQRIVGSLRAQSLQPKNFLLWGPPGSGKSYLLQQTARALGGEAEYLEMNLAQLDQGGVRSALDSATRLERPVLCFIDEVDALPDHAWPYETLLPYLEPPVPRRFPTCFCLAGSGGHDLEELKHRIRDRPKGADLLSRIPRGHEFSIPPLTAGDKVLVAVTQLVAAAAEEGRAAREVEKLALYYIAVHPMFSSARQLRALATECAPRIPVGEDRIRYDYLFPAGDPENKEFWTQARGVREKLTNSFVLIASRRPAAAHPSAPTPPVPDSTHRLAVLPFTNMSPDPQDEYFAEGLTEEMISELSQVPALRVIARTSVMRFKGATKGVLEIGNELRVGTILEGSVRKAGTKIRVTAQLIDARTEAHLWTGKFDRELDDIFAIQSEIARSVAGALHLKLFPGAPIAPASKQDLGAYTLYLRGRVLWNHRSPDSIRAALKCFEEALVIDPRYARAYSGLADCYAILADRLWSPASEGQRKSLENAVRAVELDPNLAEAHASVGLAYTHLCDWTAAERAFQRATELNPGYATAHHWYSLNLLSVGRVEEAVREGARAEEADPLSGIILQNVGYLAWVTGRPAEAIRQWRSALQTESQLDFPYMGLVGCYTQNGQRAEALESLRAFEAAYSGTQSLDFWHGMMYGMLGMRQEAEQHLERLLRPNENLPFASYAISLTYASLGDSDRFYEWILRSLDLAPSNPFLVVTCPLFTKIRSDPRYREYRRRCNLPT